MNTEKLIMFESRKASSNKIWMLFLLLGWSYGSLGNIGLQILFYLTLGGLGVWTFVRLFTLSSAIKAYNLQIAKELGFDVQDMNTLNLL